MTNQKLNRNRRTTVRTAAQRPKGIGRVTRAIRRMDWRGRLIVFGGVAMVIAAIVVVVVMTTGGEPETQTAVLPTPVPTVAPTMMPLPTPTPTEMPTTPPEPTIDPLLEKGDENERVMALQNRLMDLGYLELDQTTEYYGSATEYAVWLFQRQVGLQQDGIAGQETLLKIYADDAKSYLLLEGTRGNDVDMLQRRLEDMGYLDKVTGYYGTETIDAVKAFQDRNDLTVDGKTGEETLEMVYSPNAEPTRDKKKEEYRRANILKMLEVAEAQLGKPYVWGAEGPNSFDCSGFVYYCLRAAGSDRGRYNAKGYSEVKDWDRIDETNVLEIGDLLFFWSSARHKIGHVGIYWGDGKMIDASLSKDAIIIRDYKWNSYRFARRPW